MLRVLAEMAFARQTLADSLPRLVPTGWADVYGQYQRLVLHIGTKMLQFFSARATDSVS
jgi:hypothetical protein